jgi:hypothetical protein
MNCMKNPTTFWTILLAACLAGCSSSQDSSPSDGSADLKATVRTDGEGPAADGGLSFSDSGLSGSADAAGSQISDASPAGDAYCPLVSEGLGPWNCGGCLPAPGGSAPISEGQGCVDPASRTGTCRLLAEKTTHPAYLSCCAGCWDGLQSLCRPAADPAACGGAQCGSNSACEESP